MQNLFSMIVYKAAYRNTLKTVPGMNRGTGAMTGLFPVFWENDPYQ